MNKNEVIRNMLKVYGAFSPEEAGLLYDSAILLPPDSNIVEIGSYCGRSSVLLGQVAKEIGGSLTCIDIFKDIAPDSKTSDDMEERFKKNMEKFDLNPTLLRMTSLKASEVYNEEISLLFVDGNHKYEGVKLDCRLWLPKLKSKGIVAFHDYFGSWEGVKRAVDEETEDYSVVSSTQSLLIKRKP